jgi:hypothetical protein
MICIMHCVWKGEQEHDIALFVCKEGNRWEKGKNIKKHTHTQSSDEQSVPYKAGDKASDISYLTLQRRRTTAQS